MGKSTISKAIFNSYVSLPGRVMIVVIHPISNRLVGWSLGLAETNIHLVQQLADLHGLITLRKTQINGRSSGS